MINSKIVDVLIKEDNSETSLGDKEEEAQEAEEAEEEEEEYYLNNCQIELNLDDCPKLVIQFDDPTNWFDTQTCFECDKLKNLDTLSKQSKDFNQFLNKYIKIKSANNSCCCCCCCLTDDNRLNCLTCSKCSLDLEANKSDLMNTISNLISCIGCRSSIERFYTNQTNKIRNKSKTINNVTYPILLKLNDLLTLHESILNNPCKLYSILYFNSSKTEIGNEQYNIFSLSMNCIANNSNNNKNRRCQIHSLDHKNRKSKSINDWLPVWDSFTKISTRAKTLLIDTSKLLSTLDDYLRRHKFCSDCKLKVIRAYNILIGDLDSSKEKGFCSNLYEGIECCSIKTKTTLEQINSVTNKKQTKHHLSKKHLHLKNDKQFIANLIYKAETEIQGNRRERHAKTLDIAQEEVLICIGLHLYNRFSRIYQSIKSEEQTWQLLVLSSILTLKKAFELKFEKLQGISNLELVCAELAEAESNKIVKSKQNNKKSKSKSNKMKKNNSKQVEGLEEAEKNEAKKHIIQDDELENYLNQIDVSLNEASCGCLSEEESSNNNLKSINNSMTSSLSFSSSSSSSNSQYEMNNNYLNDFDCLNTIEVCCSKNNKNEFEDCLLITDEEKKDYYENKTIYLNQRLNRRQMLEEKFQNLKLSSSFKITPRNAS